MPVLGHTTYGSGPTPVLVLHDWFGDHTTWDPMRPYLSGDRFTYVFADLRGYGASRDLPGAYTLDEAVSDVKALADHLDWKTLALVGHSMTSLVVQRLLQIEPGRISKAVLVGPVPPTSLRLDATWLEMSRRFALAGDDARIGAARGMWGDRLSDTWVRFKMKRWREAALPEAAAAYVTMYGATDVSKDAGAVRTPLLVVGCGKDQPPFQPEALEATLRPFYPHARFEAIHESGHYPMQESPPLLATLLERFLES